MTSAKDWTAAPERRRHSRPNPAGPNDAEEVSGGRRFLVQRFPHSLPSHQWGRRIRFMSCQGPERPFLEHRAFLHHARGDRVRTPPVGRGARVTVRNEAQQELHQAPQVKVTKEKDQNLRPPMDDTQPLMFSYLYIPRSSGKPHSHRLL